VSDLDPQGMLEVVRSSPDLWERGASIAASVPDWGGAPRAVIVAGMGGSGISGDVAVLVGSVEGSSPVVVVKGYDLPAWASAETPVIAVSHSGGTEETLAVARDAIARGCPLAAVTSGGALADLVADTGGPVVRIPGDHQPRASFPLLVPPTLALVARAGTMPAADDTLARVAETLRPVMIELDDRAAADAQRLRDRVPVFVGGRGVAALVAARAKCQVNENAELPAFANEIPEANHNEIVGWGGGPDAAYTIVTIRDAAETEHARIAARFDISTDLLADVTDVGPAFRLPGGDLLTRLANGIAYVDLLSVHLALQRGVDPTPVTRIGDLKRRMESRDE
jgi:glucose/mannose-6-phosphate isomerase